LEHELEQKKIGVCNIPYY